MYRSEANLSSVLIVDDEANNLRVLHGLLSQHGYDVRAARDGESALEAAVSVVPDIILLDIKMPEMDGYEVCTRLKQHEATREIPVIFISALNNVHDIVLAFEAGGVDYITKPFQFAEVLARVKNHLTIVHQREQIMEQKAQLEAMRKRDQQRFEQISQMREEFVKSATYDLKNPLTIIRGSADIMSRFNEIRAHPHLRECVEQISESAKSMTDLVTVMLDFLRMQSSLDLNLQPVNFKQFIETQLPKFDSLTRTRAIEIFFSAHVDDAYTLMDETLMSRVLDNLLSNAINYSPDKTKISVVLSEDEKIISLDIQDEGFGIRAEDMEKLFTPFFRAKKRDGERIIEGAGLGLAIVKEILEQHRGRIEVYSEYGKGSRFRLFLPKQLIDNPELYNDHH
jgi:two-component system, sensor histidine kinase and response regulator